MDVGVNGVRIGPPDPIMDPKFDLRAAEDLEPELSVPPEQLLQRFLPPDMDISQKFRFTRAQQLPPEHDYGNVEYKFKLVGKNLVRKKHLTTQLHFRLSEGGNRMFYQLGWTDSGRAIGILETELMETLQTVQEFADRLKARTLLLAIGLCPRGDQMEEKVRRKQEALRRHLWMRSRDRSNPVTGDEAPGAEKTIETATEAAAAAGGDGEIETEHWVATVMVYRPLDVLPESREDVRICVIGDEGVGKSSLVGVLTTGELDDGEGGARLELLRHRHEVEVGQTSSICRQVLGFRPDGVPTYLAAQQPPQVGQGAEQQSTWAGTVSRSSKVVTFLDLAGHPTYSKTTSFGLTSQCPDYGMLVVSAAAAGGPGSDAPGCISETTRHHLALCEVLKIPLIVVISKTDLCEGETSQGHEGRGGGGGGNEDSDFESDVAITDDDVDVGRTDGDGDSDEHSDDDDDDDDGGLGFDHHPMFDGSSRSGIGAGEGLGGAAFSGESFTDPIPGNQEWTGEEPEASVLGNSRVQQALAEVYAALGPNVIVVDSETQLQRVCRTHPLPRVAPADLRPRRRRKRAAAAAAAAEEDEDEMEEQDTVLALLHEPSESESEDDVSPAGADDDDPRGGSGHTTPVFLVSSVRGGLGLKLLLRWLFRCPPQLDWTPRHTPQLSPSLSLRPSSAVSSASPGIHQMERMAPPHAFLAEFSVSEVFELDRVGLVLGGLLHQAQLRVGDPVWFGPLPTCVSCEQQELGMETGIEDGTVLGEERDEGGVEGTEIQESRLPLPQPQGECSKCGAGLQWFHAARIASMELHRLPVEKILAGQAAGIALDFLGPWIPRALRSDGHPEIVFDDEPSWGGDFQDDDDADDLVGHPACAAGGGRDDGDDGEELELDMDAFISPKSQEALLLNTPLPSGAFQEGFDAVQIVPGNRRRKALRGGKGLVVLGVLDPKTLTMMTTGQQSRIVEEPQEGDGGERMERKLEEERVKKDVMSSAAFPSPEQLTEYIRWRRYPSVCQGFDAQLTVESLPDGKTDYRGAAWRPLIYCRSLRRPATLVGIYPGSVLRLGRTFVCRFTFAPNDPEWMSLRSKIVVLDHGRVVRMQGRVVRLWIEEEGQQGQEDDRGPEGRPFSFLSLSEKREAEADADADAAAAAGGNRGVPHRHFLSIGSSEDCVYCNPSLVEEEGFDTPSISSPADAAEKVEEEEEEEEEKFETPENAELPLFYQRSVELCADPIPLRRRRDGGGMNGNPILSTSPLDSSVAVVDPSPAIAEHWCAVGRFVTHSSRSCSSEVRSSSTRHHPCSFTEFQKTRNRKRSSLRGQFPPPLPASSGSGPAEES